MAEQMMLEIGANGKNFEVGVKKAARDAAALAASMNRTRDRIDALLAEQERLIKSGHRTSETFKNNSAEISNLNRQYASLKQRMRSVDDQADRSNKKVGGLGGAFGNLGGIMAGAGIAIGVSTLVNVGREALAVQGTFERLAAVMENALGSRSAAQQSLREIQDYVSSTPFQVDEVSDSYIRLVNRGMKPTTQELVKMGDLAASQGKGFLQLTEAILDATTGEFERLKEFGIKGSKAGDKVTLMFKNQRVAVDNNADAIKAAIVAMGDYEGVAGSTAAISGTLEGKLSNLKDNWDLMLVSMSGTNSVFHAVIDGLNLLTTGLREASTYSFKVATSWEEMQLSLAMTGNPFGMLVKNSGDAKKSIEEDAKESAKIIEAELKKRTLGKVNQVIDQFHEDKKKKKPKAKAGPKESDTPMIDALFGDLETEAKAAEAYYKMVADEISNLVDAMLEEKTVATEMINLENKKRAAVAQTWEQLKEDLTMAEKKAKAFGDTYDLLGEQITLISQAINEALKLGLTIDDEVFNDLIKKYNELLALKARLKEEEEKEVEAKTQVSQAYRVMGDLANETFANITSGSKSAGEAYLEFGAKALSAGLDAVKANIMTAVTQQMATNSVAGIAGVALAGVAIGGIFGLLEGALSKASGIKLAKGGIISGEVTATMGEYPTAHYNPEVVAPLRDLKGILADSMGGGMNPGDFALMLSGEDIYYSYQRAARRLEATRR